MHGVENHTIQGSSQDVLCQGLLLATNHDLEIQARWIPTNANTLTDALSWFDNNKITSLVPQVIQPTFSLLDSQYLTYSNPDCHIQQHFISGRD